MMMIQSSLSVDTVDSNGLMDPVLKDIGIMGNKLQLECSKLPTRNKCSMEFGRSTGHLDLLFSVKPKLL
jgi:hypothetical protein